MRSSIKNASRASINSGRTPEWLLEDTKMRPCPDGWEFVYPEGCYVRVQRDDDPIFFAAPGFEYPDVETIDIENPLYGHFTGGFLKWHLWKATHHYHRVEDIPEYWYGIIDLLKEKMQAAAINGRGPYSLHGETRGPFDHVLNLLSAEGMMIALITNRERVHKLLEWGTKGSGPGEFLLPHAVVLDAQGRVYVSDRENRRIEIFDPNGKFLTQWSNIGGFSGLAMTKDQRIWAAGGDRVVMLNLDGQVLKSLPPGNLPGQVSAAHGIAVTDSGEIYVAELNWRVQKFVRQ